MALQELAASFEAALAGQAMAQQDIARLEQLRGSAAFSQSSQISRFGSPTTKRPHIAPLPARLPISARRHRLWAETERRTSPSRSRRLMTTAL